MTPAHRSDLDARVVGRRRLFYSAGADLAEDRPAHVRAGSGLVRLDDGRFVIVQDDASFVAVVDLARDHISAIALPAVDGIRQFDEARGNKDSKLDLEACFAIRDRGLVVAIGSGSSPRRERIALVHGVASDRPGVSVVHAASLYRAMSDDPAFSGSELNVEGATVHGSDVVFFQRGNGKQRGQLLPINATARVDLSSLLAHLLEGAPFSSLRAVRSWDLGRAGDVALTFTDGATHPSGKLAFLACAEASPDATKDGPVSAVVMGRLDDGTGDFELGTIADERGAMLLEKAEGLAFDPRDAKRAWVVVDRDDASVASELLELELGHGWRF